MQEDHGQRLLKPQATKLDMKHPGMLTLAQTAKNFVQDTFPSLWLQWHLAYRPRTAEAELALLDRLVHPGDVTVDIGANLGLYTRELARLSRKVHAFEPSPQMANLLRRTSAAHVTVHEMALSDRAGRAELLIPRSQNRLIHSLASLERHAEAHAEEVAAQPVPMSKLDAVIDEDISFVKIDIEGHEISVLNGARNTLAISQPVFLVEAEERHRSGATHHVMRFFHEQGYRGYFLADGKVLSAEAFDPHALQNPDALLPDGQRKEGRVYVNNFFFFPAAQDGIAILKG